MGQQIKYGVFLLILLAFAGCRDILTNMEAQHNALGSTNEVVVVCDENMWNSFVADTFLYYFEAPFPIMPQPEPIFDVRHFTVEELQDSPLRKELRTYVILANIADTNSVTSRMVRSDLGAENFRRAKEDPAFVSTSGRDKWANGQLIVYIFGDSYNAVAQNIVRAFPAVAERINRHDLVQIEAATYLHRQSVPVENAIREKFGISLRIPGDYKIARNEDNFIWIRQDLKDAISNITIKRFPYTSPDQLELPGFIAMRDRMGIQVEGSSVGSYMVTNAEDLPVYLYRKTLDGHFAVEGRGIWELTEDFLGGPFVTYAIVDSSEILMIDAFVHAPGTSKRDFVQRLEHIVSSLRFSPKVIE